MAKMFYTIDEAAQRLGKSEEQVRQMAQSGQLQEFRDRDRLMFKKEQVDLLAGGGEDIRLTDELEPISLSSSGSGSGLGLADNPKESTGISIFDPDATETADPSAQTQVTESATPGFQMDSASSGSGLLDLTKEADDTSLGRDLLEDVYGQETMGATATAPGDSGVMDEPAAALFEGVSSEPEPAAAPAMMAVAEAIDPTWSGISGGLALGMCLALALGVAVVLFAMTGASGALLEAISGNFWAFVGGAAGVTVVAAIAGMFLGKRG